MRTTGNKRYSIAEYLDHEDKAEERHEFHDGIITAMAPGPLWHSRVNVAICVAIGSRLRGSRFVLLGSTMRYRVPGEPHYFYPDLSVVEGPPEYDVDDPRNTTLLNSTLVVEVLSKSTESYDRGAKFDFYRQIPSLEQYVMVSQVRPLVETFLRQPRGKWLLQVHMGLDEVAELRAIRLSVPLAEIYEDIEFPPAK